jgi:hypothetical protein
MINYALDRLAADLRKHSIQYVVIGGVALSVHGYQRFTENIDLVLRTEGLDKFGEVLAGRGGLGLAGYDRLSDDNPRVFQSYPEQSSFR